MITVKIDTNPSDSYNGDTSVGKRVSLEDKIQVDIHGDPAITTKM